MTERGELVGSWAHSHEEDHDGLQVFRPAGTDLPPSRGRTTFRLLDDGGAVTGRPGPDDRGVTAEGAWELTGDVLTMTGPGWRANYHVVAADGERLELLPTGADDPDPTENPTS